MPDVTLTLTISIPDAATLTVDSSAVETLDSEGSGFDNALRWMEENAPAPQQRLQHQLLDRLHERFGLVGSRPSTGSRPYLNFYPDSRYGDGRIGALTLNSGRFYAVLDPALAREFPGSEPAEGRYLTCYIRDDSSIDLAVDLMRRALEARGWTE